MKMKKLLSLLIASSMLLASAGCGKKQEQSTGQVEITMWTKIGDDASEYDKELEALKDESLAEKFPDIKINKIVKVTGTDYRQEYDKSLMAGDAPDVFMEFSYTDIPTRIENGTIADITDLVNKWDLKKDGKVLTTFDDIISKDNKWYAIPRSAYVRGIMANTKVLQDNGFEPKVPRTWKNFAEVGSKITDKSVPRIGYTLMGMDWCAWPFTNWVWSAGGEMVRENADGTYKIAFNEDAGVDAAEYWHDMVWKYNMTQKNVLSTLDENRKDLNTGVCAFTWDEFSSLSKKMLEESGLEMTDYTISTIPTKDESIPGPALAGGEVVTFNPKATPEELEAAFKVAEYLLYDEDYLAKQWEINKKYGVVDIAVPARSDMYDKKLESSGLLSDEAIKSIIELSKNSIPEPYCPHWSDLKSQLAIPLQKILLTENMSKDEMKKLLDDCADTLYNLYPDTFKKN